MKSTRKGCMSPLVTTPLELLLFSEVAEKPLKDTTRCLIVTRLRKWEKWVLGVGGPVRPVIETSYQNSKNSPTSESSSISEMLS